MKNIINILSIILLLLAAATAQGQIIEGNVYGGGNAGNVSGNATVTVTAGDIHSLFGGARQANVGGRTFVNIDGANATSYILIDYVFGGNDIGGTIGQSATALPAALATARLSATSRLLPEVRRQMPRRYISASSSAAETATMSIPPPAAENLTSPLTAPRLRLTASPNWPGPTLRLPAAPSYMLTAAATK